MKRFLLVCGVLLVLGAGYVAGAYLGLYGRHEGPGEVAPLPVPAAVLDRRAEVQAAASAPGAKHILFGDLHVHTTFSTDAFLVSLPMIQGEGAHPPADACDFARFCSGLDFWAITDHAEGLTPQRWAETKDAIRQCNAVSGDPASPDVAAFLGWEWTQIGQTPDDHYGHKNVIFAGLADDEVPARPIGASGNVGRVLRSGSRRGLFTTGLLDFPNRQRYFDFAHFLEELSAVPVCPDGVDVRELPVACTEFAPTPRQLFEKLDQWDFDSLVIPHGTTWGLYTPAGSTWEKQLAAGLHDPNRQTLLEVFSGHGNSEEYRDWRAAHIDADGQASCPPPSKDYLPSCWQAGEIVRQRCLAAEFGAEECEARAARARQHYLDAQVSGFRTVPGARAEDWLDAGQCRDCFLPSFNYRPGGSAQYLLALSNFDDPSAPHRFRFGFMASSDTHTARPGSGYKEVERGSMSDGRGARDATWAQRLAPPEQEALPESVPFDPATTQLQGFQFLEFERQSSFFLTGGLIAAHATGRDRRAVWQALTSKEVYATSGERILLWFDLLESPANARVPMGGSVRLNGSPRFRVRAVGAHTQQPGCPDYSVSALSPERLEHVCRGECYNPSDERRLITRIEVVRIRPQIAPDEPMADLIDDPWQRFACPPDPGGCVVEFDDPDFAGLGRDTVYYVRAIQEPSPAIHADPLGCEYDENGNCVEVKLCFGDYRTPADDDCLAEHESRAWSSPIFVDYTQG